MTPNVSVIIRTLGRPSLRRAIESVERQQRSDIEIVVVAASAEVAPVASQTCSVRWLSTETPLHRSAAANAGLQAAQGRYLIFLDDDDWFESGHLQKLVDALEKSPAAVLAHTGVRMQSGSGELLQEYDSAFEPWQLIAAPRIPIHAAMFRRSTVEAGHCRFDMQLDVYEDWDFWLQLRKMGPFVHVPGISAVYVHSATGSGVQSIAYGDEPYLRLWRKWCGLYDVAWLAALFEQVPRMSHQLSQLAHQITQLTSELQVERGTVRHLTSEVAALRNIEQSLGLQLESQGIQLEKAAAEIQVLLNSRSWKLTAPLRNVANRGREIRQQILNTLDLLPKPDHVLASIQLVLGAFETSGWRGAAAAYRHAKEGTDNSRDSNYLRLRYRKDVAQAIPGWLKVARRLARHPRISVIVPCYETPADFLRETINSVLNQAYKEWELILADDASASPHVLRIVDEYVARDSRIRSSPGTANCGVAATSNRAIAAATGEFVVLLDHDDMLEPHALLRVAQSIVAEDPDFVYSDETLLTEDGSGVVDFVFRPAFSLEYLRSHPYIVHLVGFRTRLLREIGGFDEKLRISQDYDLILRICERARTVVHLPELLYCWRQYASSSGAVRQDQVTDISRRILEAHLARCGEEARVEPGRMFNYYDVRYPLHPGLKVAIIIPTKNCGNLVRQCIESIGRSVGAVAYHIVLVDHQSDDAASLGYFDSLRPSCTVLRYAGVFNFSAINNWATAQLSDEYTHYLYCNNDIEAIESGWLERMLELAQKPDVGAVGAKLIYPDQLQIQHGGVTVGLKGAAEHNGKFTAANQPDGCVSPGYRGSLVANHEVSAVTAACMLMRKDAFAKVGGFDEKLAVGFGDIDLCLRIRRAGYRVLFCPGAVLIHHESYTRGKSVADPHPADSGFFLARWRDFIDNGDPFFNPNLWVDSTIWEYNSPLPVALASRLRVTQLDGLKEMSLKVVSGSRRK